MAKKILLADDSITIQKVVELAFRDAGFEVTCVGDGASAIRRLQESVPDLVLADVQMPEQNGYEVCRAVKANPHAAHVPVLLLRGTFEPWDEQKAAEVGAEGSIIKPFESDKLVEQVQEILNRPAAASPVLESQEIAPPGVVTSFQEELDAEPVLEVPPALEGVPVIALSAAGDEPELVNPSDWLAQNPAGSPASNPEVSPPAPPAPMSEGEISTGDIVGDGGTSSPAPLWEAPPEVHAEIRGASRSTEAEGVPAELAAGTGDSSSEDETSVSAVTGRTIDYRSVPSILDDRGRYDPTGIRDPADSISYGQPRLADLADDDRQALITEAVRQLSEKVIREMVSHVVPDVAERIIRAKVEEIEKKAGGR